MYIECDSGRKIKTCISPVFDDLPWDAYLLNEDGSVYMWADGYTESEAMTRLVRKYLKKDEK